MATTVRAFRQLMQQRVTIKRFASYNDFGEASYGDPVTYQAAVVGEMKRVLNAQGEETPTNMSAYLMTADAVRPEDEITLSTGDVGSTEQWAIQPKIIATARYPFTRGQFFTAVHLGTRREN